MYFWNFFERFVISRRAVEETNGYFERLARKKGYDSVQNAMSDEDFRNRYEIISRNLQAIQEDINPIRKSLLN
ncbi:MAG: hypothetical protein HY831_04260 [Candidatus Aenigmarchaeota archaeon]|nr:hypothetical protein [Candidatus Aenigmarchaeota archaeon]